MINRYVYEELVSCAVILFLVPIGIVLTAIMIKIINATVLRPFG